nr:tyrosine-type recombinase/integrase [Deltaproteobacteria bacterium]
MSCKVISNRHGVLTFRISWRGKRYWKSTGRKDTPENRVYVNALAAVISDAIKRKTFSLAWFQETNKPEATREEHHQLKTVGHYYQAWIERQRPPLVRPHLERDYREQFERYILPKFRRTPMGNVTRETLEELRSYLLHDWKNKRTGKPLSLKTVKNVIDGTFRALWRDVRNLAELKGVDDPFVALRWPRMTRQAPDPFDEEERDTIIHYFRTKVPFYFPFVHVLFWSGMRPSEALGLRWGDVDTRRGLISISKSRYRIAEGSPKTAGSERQIRLLPSVVDVLRGAKPLHAVETDYVFVNTEGAPVDFHTWRKKHWYRALRAKEIRPRGPYHTRHTFISVGLSNGANIKWLAEYCG